MSKIEIESSALETLKTMAQRLQQERDELLAVVTECKNTITSLGDMSDGDVSPYAWKSNKCREVELKAEKIIAKFTQEQPVSDWQERMN